MPYLSYGYCCCGDYRQTGRKCVEPYHVYIVIQSSGCCGCAVGVSLGRAACRHNFLCGFPVFPLLLLPFFIAWFLRVFVKKAHRYLLEFHDTAFYLWAVALAIVSGQTVRSLVNSDAPVFVEVLIALAGLIACCVQFYLGKRIGGHYNDRISGGQALGQKNTVLAIWMSYTYLNPLSSVGPGSYVLWQNIINSYQLWKKRKRES